jgi:hypothetical protein
MLETPLGQIKIYIDGTPVPYIAKHIAYDKTCRDLDGRYIIEITFIPDGEEHTISCCLYNYKKSEDDYIESGERLELKSFCQGSVKLSIGMEGDIGYLSNGMRIGEYDYDNSYLDNGVQFEVLPYTKTSKYVFGIAWINKVNDENEVQTWYGADPSIM